MAKEKQEARDILRQHGLRPTKARCLLIALLCGTNNHLSTDEIVQALTEEGQRVGTATLYQNLDKLAQKGLLFRFIGPDGLMRYDFNLTPHYHLICKICNRIRDIDIDEAHTERLSRPVCHHTGKPISDWRLEGVRLELQGVCPACRGRQ